MTTPPLIRQYLAVGLIEAATLVVIVVSAVVAYRDLRSRNTNPWLVVISLLVVWPVGLLLWFLLRRSSEVDKHLSTSQA
jgi:ABC-type nickel/cobalt efflux system permease component RcnA